MTPSRISNRRIYRKDGSIIWIAENVRAIRDAKGELALL